MRVEVKATDAEALSAVKPEQAEARSLAVAGRLVIIAPLKYRWQALFWKHALAGIESETTSLESVLKAFVEGDTGFNFSGELVRGAMASIESLPVASAVVLLAQPGERIAPEMIEAELAKKAEWLRDNSTIEELRDVVDAQAEVERLVQRVGERWPARFESLLVLAGVEKPKDFLRQLSNSLLSKLRETATGAGG